MVLACAGAWAAHPFQLSPQLDIPLAVGATGAAAFGQYRLSGMEPRDTSFKRSDLFFWDRPVAGNWNSQAALASDLLTGVGALPLVLGAVAWKNGDASGSDFATQSLMLYEVLALQSGINLGGRMAFDDKGNICNPSSLIVIHCHENKNDNEGQYK